MAEHDEDSELNQPNPAQPREATDKPTDKPTDKAADKAADNEATPVLASVALLPEPFTVNAEAVGLAAAAARAVLRRTTGTSGTSGAHGRFSRPSQSPPLDAFRAAAEPLKVP